MHALNDFNIGMEGVTSFPSEPSLTFPIFVTYTCWNRCHDVIGSFPLSKTLSSSAIKILRYKNSKEEWNTIFLIQTIFQHWSLLFTHNKIWDKTEIERVEAFENTKKQYLLTYENNCNDAIVQWENSRVFFHLMLIHAELHIIVNWVRKSFSSPLDNARVTLEHKFCTFYQFYPSFLHMTSK